MKNIFKVCISLFSILPFFSCDKGLEELNVNRVNPTTLDPSLLLNNAIINTSFSTRTQVNEMAYVQQMVTPNGGVLAGGNFNVDSRDGTLGSLWASYYQNVIKYTHDAIVKSKDLPARSNMYHMARIWQAYAFMVLTDTYGATPIPKVGPGLPIRYFFLNMISSRIFIQN